MDATVVQNYFVRVQAQNKNFIYIIYLNKHDSLINVFQVDANSKAAYNEFGDIAIFDTMYLTNKYNMSFPHFVYHQGQSILLGYKLISRENTNSFIWLFKIWFSYMSGHAPSRIITNQDKSD